MDDPLVPIDAEHLEALLRDVTVAGNDPFERALQRIQWALAQPRETLRAPDVRLPLQHPSRFKQGPLEILDLLRHIEPSLRNMDGHGDRWVELVAACDSLMDHVINPKDVVGDYYYFRKNWVKVVGRGQGWAIVLLRDRCFDDKEGALRDTWWLPDYDWLAQRVGVDAKTIGDWLNGGMQGFVRVLAQEKGRDKATPQRVGYHIWVALRDPLTAEDQKLYEERVQADIEKVAGEVRGESELSANGVRGESELSAKEVSGKSELSDAGVSGGNKLAAEGVSGENELVTGGSEENPNCRKYFNTALLNRERQQDQTVPIPPSDFSEVIARVANCPTDGAGVLSLLLKKLQIHNPSRARILKERVPASVVWGWALYAAYHEGTQIESFTGFMVHVLLDREDRETVPPPFDQLACLHLDQWTSFALEARRRAEGIFLSAALPDDPATRELFRVWRETYGGIDFGKLPFGLGKEAAARWATECEERANETSQTITETEHQPQVGLTPEEALAQGVGIQIGESVLGIRQIWDVALGELQLQLTGATFDTWLRRTKPISCRTQDGKPTFVIEAHNGYAKDWLENRLATMIKRTLAGIAGKSMEIKFVVRESLAERLAREG